MLRVLTVGDLKPEETPYRVRVSMPAKYAAGARIGGAVTLRATLQPPPEPIEPGGFDFARSACFARLGATGYATSKVAPFEGAPTPPMGSGRVVEGRCAKSGDQCPHQGGLVRRDRRDRRRPHHRRTGRHLGGSDPVDARLRPHPYPFHLGPAHGDHGGNRVLARPRAARARAGARATRSRNGRPPPRLPPRPSILRSPAPPYRRFAPGS
jgi:hypothetical protein